ncbi:MAG: hypothetical protein ACJ8FY_18235 [Gemmataceae bacterium]
MNRSLGFILFLALVTVSGCGRDKPKYANVKGKVTYNGIPIEKGQISFAIEGQPPSSMKIVGGEFNGQAMVGSNKISVSAKKKAANAPVLPEQAQIQMKGYQKYKANDADAGSIGEFDASMVDYIPPEWGPQSTERRTVEAGVNNEFEFNIKGKE